MKLQERFELIFCINLKDRIDRRNESIREFDKLGFDPKLFVAVENENPVVGCLQSHLALLKYASIFKKDILIFEDDVHFTDDYDDTIEKALDELETLDWDMLYLGGNVLSNIYQKTEHLGRLSHCQSTHAYAVNYNFVDKLIKKLESHDTHIDIMYAWDTVPNNRCYITIPMVAIQRESYSDIMGENSNYDIPIARFKHFLVRQKV